MRSIAVRSVKKFKLWKVLAAIVVLGICATFSVYVRVPQQCVLCRAERSSYRVCGVSFSDGIRNDGEFTRWYVSHRPPHNHVWFFSGAGCLAECNFFGLVISLDLMKRHPVLQLDPAEELKFVKESDEAVLSQFFTDAASQDTQVRLRAADTARRTLSEVK